MAPDIEAVTKLLQEEKVSKLPTKKVEVKFLVKFWRGFETLPQSYLFFPDMAAG